MTAIAIASALGLAGLCALLAIWGSRERTGRVHAELEAKRWRAQAAMDGDNRDRVQILLRAREAELEEIQDELLRALEGCRNPVIATGIVRKQFERLFGRTGTGGVTRSDSRSVPDGPDAA